MRIVNWLLIALSVALIAYGAYTLQIGMRTFVHAPPDLPVITVDGLLFVALGSLLILAGWIGLCTRLPKPT